MTRKICVSLITHAVLTVVLIPGVAHGQRALNKLTPNLQLLSSQDPRNVELAKRHVHLQTGAGQPEPMVDAFVEVRGNPKILESYGVRIRTVAGRFATADIPIHALERLAGDPNVVRVEEARKVQSKLDQSVPETGANHLWGSSTRPLAPPWTGNTGQGVVVGIVDSGIDLNHADFKDPITHKTRISSVWDQTSATRGTHPPGFNYGNECTTDQINALSQTTDLVTVNNFANTASLLLGAGGSSNFPVGAQPNGVVVADFNGDGLLDMAVVNAGTGSTLNPGTVSILLANGKGGFSPAPQSPVSIGDPNFYLTSIAVGDFNRDGIPDLVVTNYVTGTPATAEPSVFALLGNGDGTFSPPKQPSGTPLPPILVPGAFHVTVGDFNGDGIPDLAVSTDCLCSGASAGNLPTSISILLGNGDGTFGAPSVVAQGFAPTGAVPGNEPFWIAAGDFNGDGLLDLAVTTSISFTGVGGPSPSAVGNGVSILFGNGDGTFRLPVGFILGSGSAAGSLRLAVADFDGDGKSDLVVTTGAPIGPKGSPYSTSGGYVLLGNGDGTFAAPKFLSVNPADTLFAIAVGDFNGDGVPDLAVTVLYPPDGPAVSVLLGIGDGTFGPPTNFPVGTDPVFVAAANFHSSVCDEVDENGHGTFVAGIAAGSGGATGNGQLAYRYIGMAPGATLDVVKVTQFSSAIVDAIGYIEARASDLVAPVVINVSLGSDVGPHDGTSTYEQMLDLMTGPRQVIVVAAGNEAGAKHHASGTVSNGLTDIINFNADSGLTNLTIDLWYRGADTLGVQIISPCGSAIPLTPQYPGSQVLTTTTGCGQVLVANEDVNAIYPNGDHEILIHLATETGASSVAQGQWAIVLIGNGCGAALCVMNGSYDAWIDAGSCNQGPCAVFADHVSDASTVEIPATATKVIAVGSYVTKETWTSSIPVGEGVGCSISAGTTNCSGIDGVANGTTGFPSRITGAISPFSSQGPRRSCSNFSNPECAGVQKPDLTAPGENIVSSFAAGTHTTVLEVIPALNLPAANIFCYDPTLPTKCVDPDGQHVVGSGTSAAAPHVAGAVALLLAQNPNLTSDEVKAALRNAKTDSFTLFPTGATPNNVWGYGKLAVDLASASLSIQVTVPNVVGLSQTAAAAAINTANLFLGIVTHTGSNTVPIGNVVSQSPAPGTSVLEGTVVILVVSSGVTVPNVAGLTQTAAQAALIATNLMVGAVTELSSATVPIGSVIGQSPAAGTNVDPGTAVALVISGATVPNVVGLTETAAQTAITSASLTVGTLTQTSSATVPLGTVISETPAAGTLVAQSTPVNLVISTGPPGFVVPNVVGLAQTAAQAAITSAGLTVGTVTQTSSATVPSGSVISQTPPAGTSLAQSAPVNLVISTGPPVFIVPTVVGLTQTAAQSAITSAGLSVGTVTQTSSATVPSESVVSETPTAGTSLLQSAAVNLVVSSGPPTGSVSLVIKVVSLTRDGGPNSIIASLTIANQGTDTADNVQVTSSTLNAVPTSTTLPISVGSVAAGDAPIPIALHYPDSAAAPGTATALRVSLTYTNAATGISGNAGGSFRLTAPPAAVLTTRSIGTGVNYSCAVLSSGTVQCWGENDAGQLGTGATTGLQTCHVPGYGPSCSTIPVSVPGISTAVDVSVGGSFACALLSDASVWCWGQVQNNGNLGNGGTYPFCNTGTCASAPVRVTGISTAAAVSVGVSHACALLSDGTVWCWGANNYGELGAPIPITEIPPAGGGPCVNGFSLVNGAFFPCTSSYFSATPVKVQGIGPAISVSAGGSGGGNDFTCAVLSDGTVWCWGLNNHGQLGGTATPTVQATGLPYPGSCPNPQFACSATPVRVAEIATTTARAVAVSAGALSPCAVLSDGTAWCWGQNQTGQLGNPSVTTVCSGNGANCTSPTPVQVVGINAAVAVSVGWNVTCALLSGGAVQCWGDNEFGELGNGESTGPQFCTAGQYPCSTVPVAVTGIGTSASVSAGYTHACALLSDGTAHCWGDNEFGELGDSTSTGPQSCFEFGTACSTSPVPIIEP